MQNWDVIIVGAGPGGLAAALYMGRYRRRVLVLHDGKARALRIPDTHNAPGFPRGISGIELIGRMTAHAVEFGAEFAECEIISASRRDARFVLNSANEEWQARSLLLATGIVLNEVALDHDTHEQAIADGVLRYCPICDGHEHIDARIGVIGCDSQGAAEAMFLRRFSPHITLVPQRYGELTRDELNLLRDSGIGVVESSMAQLVPHDDRMDVCLEDGSAPLSFDVVYPALGSTPRTELAAMLGLHLDEEGKVAADAPFATEIDGLYCVGDMVSGLNQISVSIGHGAIAATKAHNWLRELDGETLG